MAAASRRLCRMALDKEGIEAGGGAIEVSDCDLRQWDSMRFKASFIEMPRFELSDYKSLEIEATDYFGRLDEISARLLTRTGVEPYPAQVEHELRYAGADSADDRQAAAGRMKLMMILKRIALQESIGIDERDIGTLAAENEVTVGELKRFWAEGDGLSRLADTLSAEAVLSYLDEIQEPAHIPA